MFYEKDKNVYKDPEGFTIEAVKDHVWHGLSGIGVRFKTENESLLFSSDTVHDKELWRQLYSEKRTTRIPLTQKEFVEASFIYGDINDYIERTWSEERFHDAVASFNDSVVIHDIAIRDSIVHTDYRRLHNTVLQKDKTILTHSPDRMTSEWVLSDAGKSFQIKGGDFFELVGEKLYPLDADIYHKEAGKYYVGYKKRAQGKTTIYENDGALHLSQREKSGAGSPLYQVDLYECIAGKYFPVLEDKKSVYWERPDGEIELVELCKEGSRGKVIDNYRDCLSDLQPKPAGSAGFQPAGSPILNKCRLEACATGERLTITSVPPSAFHTRQRSFLPHLSAPSSHKENPGRCGRLSSAGRYRLPSSIHGWLRQYCSFAHRYGLAQGVSWRTLGLISIARFNTLIALSDMFCSWYAMPRQRYALRLFLSSDTAFSHCSVASLYCLL